MFYLTNKAALCELTESKYLLPTFIFPGDKQKFEAFWKNNSGKKLIEKNEANRGVRIITKDEINFESFEKVYQEFLGELNLFWTSEGWGT